jgi:hypothetical protein
VVSAQLRLEGAPRAPLLVADSLGTAGVWAQAGFGPNLVCFKG